MSEDSLRFTTGINHYAYVHNRPTRAIDPFGLADVYVWMPKGEFFGHTSLGLDNGTYISWWPQDDPARIPKKQPCGCVKDNLYHAPAIPDRAFQADIADEQRPPDVIIHIDGLDEAAIAAWWEKFRHNPANVWDTSKQNCSTTVYDALRAGGAFPAADRVWNPIEVAIYAERVKAWMTVINLIRSVNAGNPDLSLLD